MGKFDVNYAAYERAMQQNNYFGLRGEAIREQLGRYSIGLQNDEKKAANKKFGREYGRALAEERRMAALTAGEQTALTDGLSGTKQVPEPVVTPPSVKPETQNVKIAEKMKVGTPKTGFKFYLIDKNGNTYQVDKTTYKAAKKGKMANISSGTVVDTTSPKVARRVRNAGDQIKTNNATKYNIINDPEAYHVQQQDMYNKLLGKGEQVPMHNINVINDPVAYRAQQQDMYNKLLSKGEQVPMHKYNIINDPEAYKLQRRNELTKAFSSEESILKEIKGDIRQMQERLNGVASTVEQNSARIDGLAGKISGVGAAVRQNGAHITELAGQIDGVASTVNKNGQQISKLTEAITKQGDDIAKLTKQLGKTNKRLAIVALVTSVAAGAIGYLLGKSNNETKQEVPVDNTQPLNQEAVTAIDSVQAVKPEVVTAVDSTKIATIQEIQKEQSENNNAEQIADTTQNKLFLPINTLGQYETQKGDSFWRIAEKYLKDKYHSEPEKFENLPENKKDALIQKECERIMKQNGYWYDENHNFPVPMLYQKIQITMPENFDKAA